MPRLSAALLLLSGLTASGCAPPSQPFGPAQHREPTVQAPAASQDEVKALGDGALAPSPPPSLRPVRTAGDLTVSSPPDQPGELPGLHLRTHVDGLLSRGNPRRWVGPEVPTFVELLVDNLELFLLDPNDGDFLAFYREPYGVEDCDPEGPANCRYVARLYDGQGNERWQVSLDELLSAQNHLEIQDIRYTDGVLYFNEACQSDSREAEGDCSALVAYAPRAKRILWRTKNLVSNNQFFVHGDYIVAGYGFTAERDFIHIVSRATGAVLQKLPVASAPERYTLIDEHTLRVSFRPGEVRWFTLQGWDTAKPRLIPATAKPVRRVRDSATAQSPPS